MVFDDPDQTLDAVTTLRARGYEIDDVHTPFPVHGMDEAMGLRETRLAYASLIGGAAGLSIALFVQIWTHSVSWPLNVGGKSMIALPALIPVSFELTVLLSGIATVVGLLWACRLRPRKDIPKSQPHIRVNDDRFVVLVIEKDGGFVPERFRTLCAALDPEEVIESWKID